MRRETDSENAKNALWIDAALTFLRLALVVFLVWALFSSRFPAEPPFAEDSSSTQSHGRTAADPAQVDRVQFN